MAHGRTWLKMNNNQVIDVTKHPFGETPQNVGTLSYELQSGRPYIGIGWQKNANDWTKINPTGYAQEPIKVDNNGVVLETLDSNGE